MQWRIIDPLRPPAGTVVAGSFDIGSPDYDEQRLTQFEPTGAGTYYITRAGVQILATSFEHAALLANHLDIEWQDLCPTIAEVDASDIGGSIGEALNTDLRNN